MVRSRANADAAMSTDSRARGVSNHEAAASSFETRATRRLIVVSLVPCALLRTRRNSGLRELDKLPGGLDSVATQGHTEHIMIRSFALGAAAAAVVVASPAGAQSTIKIGEMNSYKAQPAFLDPYKKGWEMAVEEINASGGVLGKKLEVVSRDDGGNPGDAVRVAN